MSPLILSALIFCVWPMVLYFVGFQIGRRRLIIRSPIKLRLAASDDEQDEQIAEERPQSPLQRLRNHDVGFGK